MKGFIAWMMVLQVVVMAGCAQMSGEKDVYYVLFDSQPMFYDTKVYAMGKPVGEILSREKIALNCLKLTLHIDDDYQQMIKDTTVFYENMGKLNYSNVGNIGKPIVPGARMLGFDSKMSLYWFKTKTLLGQSAMVAARKADQLYKQTESAH